MTWQISDFGVIIRTLEKNTLGFLPHTIIVTATVLLSKMNSYFLVIVAIITGQIEIFSAS